jgi:hypothetical protein
MKATALLAATALALGALAPIQSTVQGAPAAEVSTSLTAVSASTRKVDVIARDANGILGPVLDEAPCATTP